MKLFKLVDAYGMILDVKTMTQDEADKQNYLLHGRPTFTKWEPATN